MHLFKIEIDFKKKTEIIESIEIDGLIWVNKCITIGVVR